MWVSRYFENSRQIYCGWSYIIVLLVIHFTVNLQSQYLYVAVVLVLLPLLDKGWGVSVTIVGIVLWLVSAAVMFLLLLHPKGQIYQLLMMLMFVVIPEEIYFRAYLINVFKSKWLAIAMSSLMFMLVHYLNAPSVNAILTFLPGLILGYLFWRFKSLLLVVVTHFAFNVFYIFVARDFFAWIR